MTDRKKTARPRKSAASRNHTQERAEFWRVDIRTMQRWKAQRPPVPVDDIAAMIVWYSRLPGKSQDRLTPTFRARLHELRAAGSSDAFADPDFLEFERAYRGDDDPQQSLQGFQRNRAFWAFKLDKAQRASDEAAIDFATKQLIRFESAIHDAQLRAQRLGIDQGSLIAQPEAERIFRSAAYWLLRGLDNAILEIASRVAAASAHGPITPEELRQYIEPQLLKHCFLTPLVRATQVHAATTLPKWVPAAFRETLDDTLENGAAEFDAIQETTTAESRPPADATAT